MSLDARLKKLVPVLSARERAMLVLQSIRNKTPEDPEWRKSMPEYQQAEFNRYIRLINRCGSEVPFMIAIIEKEVDKLELLSSLWFALLLWRTNLAEIDFLASVMAREPITESAHRRLVQAQENALLPVSALALELAEHQRGWRDEDLETCGSTNELVVKDHSWQRLRDEAEAQVRTAVKGGELESAGKGDGLKVRSGSFDAWVGRPAKAYPAWAGDYEVFPDDQAEGVEASQATLANLRNVINLSPLERSGHDVDGECSLEKMSDGLVSRLKAGLTMRWAELRELEIVIGEVQADFGGVDPLKAVNREILVRCHEGLLQLHRGLVAAHVELELPEPSDDDVGLIRQFICAEHG